MSKKWGLTNLPKYGEDQFSNPHTFRRPSYIYLLVRLLPIFRILCTYIAWYNLYPIFALFIVIIKIRSSNLFILILMHDEKVQSCVKEPKVIGLSMQ